MNSKSNNGANKSASNKGRKGPRPIVTVAQLREKLLREMMVKEMKKIDRKMTKLIRREALLRDKLLNTQTQLDGLREVRSEYAAEASKA